MNILVHTSFIGDTGYNNHARSFFTALNKYHNVKIRNYTIGSTWSGYSENCHDREPYLTDEMRGMLILQTLHNNDGTRSDLPLYGYKGGFKPDINIILNDVNHYYFYENYDEYTIGYNVWETTEYPKEFFNQIKKFNEFWVPSEWQKNNLIAQGYDENKIKVVPEGVDGLTFKPSDVEIKKDCFTFLLFGRWEYRKSTKEIIETFIKTFKEEEPVKLIISVDNKFANDGMSSTEERLSRHNLKHKNIEVIHFPSREEYINYLKTGDVFVSCARSEGWNLPLIEAMACGTPSIYSNWGAQLQFAKGMGIPVNTLHYVPANKQDPSFVGNYIEPNFTALSLKMRDAYENFKLHKKRALSESDKIRKEFDWDLIAKNSIVKEKIEEKRNEDFVFVTTGNLQYMPVIEKLAKSINEFSKAKLIVYGVDCDIPINYPNVIKRKLNPPRFSGHDRWYWKQYACIESLKENYNNFIWIDGDVVVNTNIDTIEKYFKEIENYPLSDIHLQEEFYGYYYNEDGQQSQPFNYHLCKLMNVNKERPYMHVCMYIYNKNCGWWFEEILKMYKSLDLNNYNKFFLWNDEGIDNALRWKHGFKKHLPISNFDTSSYDGDNGQTNETLQHFYTFCLEEGPKNFNRIYGFQQIPLDKSSILYFHGNKNGNISDEMINFLKMTKEDTFYKSEHFFTDIYKLENLGDIKEYEGSTLDVAYKFGWFRAIYHEIYNLRDYYFQRIKKINEGDIVVDLGGNVGIFNRWAYSQGASKVISFEPDKRYFKLLSLNSDRRSILFNAAMSNKIGKLKIHESEHLGGSNIFGEKNGKKSYDVRSYSLNHLFETGLIDRIDFLKVDVEGAEILVFDGISDENLRRVKNIAMEYHHGHLNFDETLRDNLIKRFNNSGFNTHLLFLGSDYKLQMLYCWR